MKRSDVSGAVTGLTDTIVLNGGEVCYEPFWVRCFRFVRITVEAGPEAVAVYRPRYRQTGYPLETQAAVRSSAPWVEKLWTVCLRTLENCMMETYMDCPYYEQLQFAMDTRLEALFTYAVSADAALARKALIDFHYGMQPEGLTAGKYPSAYLQILSTYCHAWSALPLYEFVHTIAGIGRQADGMLRVAPHLMDLPDLSGQAITEKGPVLFRYWRDSDGHWQYELEVPAGLAGRFVFPDGSEATLHEGSNFLEGV